MSEIQNEIDQLKAELDKLHAYIGSQEKHWRKIGEADFFPELHPQYERCEQIVVRLKELETAGKNALGTCLCHRGNFNPLCPVCGNGMTALAD